MGEQLSTSRTRSLEEGRAALHGIFDQMLLKKEFDAMDGDFNKQYGLSSQPEVDVPDGGAILRIGHLDVLIKYPDSQDQTWRDLEHHQDDVDREQIKTPVLPPLSDPQIPGVWIG